MKVIIKTLKAPWPDGAKVGDIVAFEGETAPAWAVGKYTPALEDAEVDFRYEPKLIAGDAPRLEQQAADTEKAKIAAVLAAADEQARRELNARVLAAEQQLAAAKADLEASLSREATLQGHLSDTQKLNEAAAGELEKVRGQVDDLQAQLTAAKSETKAAKK